MSCQATLLLPLETSSTNKKITPDFMKDHIAFCDGDGGGGGKFPPSWVGWRRCLRIEIEVDRGEGGGRPSWDWNRDERSTI
jgi:hypothetical protein